VSRNHLL
jgi:hypothetical protein